MNVLANFAGSGWTALMSLGFVPLYIHFMGIEAYGLVGVFVTLQAMMAVLDMGLSSTLNREMARLSVREGTGQEMRNLLRTLELIFWPVAILIASGLLLLAPVLAERWLRVDAVALPVTVTALMLMGVAIAVQWPFGLYAGGLLGLQRQVLLNGISVSMATLRGAGAVLVLWWVSPTIVAFFAWQVIVSLLQTLLTGVFLWRSVPVSPRRSRFEFALLRSIGRFAAGMSGVSVLAVILTQLDKVILSRILTLEMFGYYTLASMVAASLYRLVTPIFSALYPRFTELAALEREDSLRELYHRVSQLMSVVILPVGAVVALFAPELLFIWTRNPATVEHASLLLSLLITGTALHGLTMIPWGLQLAHGWTRLGFYTNLGAVVILGPAIVLFSIKFGAFGAAAMWALVASGYLIAFPQLMHRRLLQGQQWQWYVKDIGFPLIAVLAVALPARWLVSPEMPVPVLLLALSAISLASLVACVLAAPRVRTFPFRGLSMGGPDALAVSDT